MKETQSEDAIEKVKLTGRLMILPYVAGQIEEKKSVPVPRAVEVKIIVDRSD